MKGIIKLAMLGLGLASLCFHATAQQVAKPMLVDASFVDNRVFVSTRSGGQPIRFITDSGGGFNAISIKATRRLGLKVDTSRNGDGIVGYSAFPDLDPNTTILKAPPFFMDGRLAVVDQGSLSLTDHADGFLGGRYLGGFVWHYDYPRRKLWRLEHYQAETSDAKLPLHFAVEDTGQPSMFFGRMEVVIDEKPLQMLFDTGATITLTDASAAAFGKNPGDNIGGSFIEHEVFEEWHQRHPDWRVLENADLKASQQRRMIEVPSVSIRGIASGPVWFAEQPTGAFTNYMSSMMDDTVVGAIGGSALRYYDFVVNYGEGALYIRSVTK